MAGFTDTLRGDGLARAQRALAGLEGDPQRLDRARIRFDDSPPPYTSDQSGTTTRSQSPNPPGEEQRRRQERQMQLAGEREASKPDKQFSVQVEEERRRIWNSDPSTSWIKINPGDTTFKEEAREIVKERWVEQGIWNNKWNYYTLGRWKHEEPLELESESETDTEAGLSPPFFFFPKPQRKSRPPKSDDEKRRIAERRVVRKREREASRPYHQLIYQISRERERIQEESVNGGGAGAADINTIAYENVKNTWNKRGIWNKRWGLLPGMSWKHEEPLEEEAAEGPAPQVNLAENGSHEVGEEFPLRNIFGHPATSPVESNHRQASGVMSTSQQGPSTDIDSTGLENSDAEHSPSAPNSPPFSSAEWVLRPTTGQASRPSRKNSPHKDGQPASASFGPVPSSKVSKVSKAAVKKKPGSQRRLNISPNVSSDCLLLSSGVDAAESQPSPPPDGVTPRRSKRIQPPVSGVAKDPAKTASTHSSKRAVRSKPERKVASNLTTRSSAKPQGVRKKKPAKTTRGKTKK